MGSLLYSQPPSYPSREDLLEKEQLDVSAQHGMNPSNGNDAQHRSTGLATSKASSSVLREATKASLGADLTHSLTAALEAGTGTGNEQI